MHAIRNRRYVQGIAQNIHVSSSGFLRERSIVERHFPNAQADALARAWAEGVEKAVPKVLKERRYLTPDLGGTSTIREVAEAV